MADGPLLVVEGLSKYFGDVPILNRASLTLRAGTITLLTGTNGSGKTTLVNCITGFDLKYSGRVMLKKRPLLRKPPELRARLGLVRSFQHPHLFPGLTVGDHLILGRVARSSPHKAYFRRGRQDLPPGLVDELELHQILRIEAQRLSLGEMRLANTARALATAAEVLLLDEPLASLHGRRRHLVVEALQRRRARGCALLVIEHATREMGRVADQHIHLNQGRLHEEGR